MFKKKINIGTFCFILLVNFLTFISTKAAEPPKIVDSEILPWGKKEIGDKLEDTQLLETVLPNLLSWGLGFLASSAIIVIMVWGYMYLTSFGGEQTTKGKDTIMYGAIGLIIVILSYAIVSIVQNLDFFI